LFTGIVTEIGRVVEVERRADLLVARIEAAATTAGLGEGDSVAVGGCCLTAVKVGGGAFSCELTPETLRRTSFEQRLAPGTAVNLERPLAALGRFDGHIVQGHVDGVGRVVGLERLGESAEMAFEPPAELLRYLVLKGSVAIEGVSLTVAALDPPSFTVALIPYTLERTTLGEARVGDRVNLEVDVVAKYVERLLEAYRSGG
jgi:riboflavin synthase